MLVLTRRAQQSIRIGDSIKVTILRVKGNTVRVGVQAPDSVHIVRSELPDFGSAEKGIVEEEIEIPIPPIVPRLRRRMSLPPTESREPDGRKIPAPAPQNATFTPEAGVTRPR